MPISSNAMAKPRRPKKSRPFRPTRPSAHACALPRTNEPAALMMLVLKLPQSPLSAETTMTSVLLSGRGSRTTRSGCAAEPTRAATLPSTRCIWTAYGRAAVMRSCARRNFDAATIFIAFVICCVFLTARTRRRKSISDGIVSGRGRLPGGELGYKCLHRGVQRALRLVIKSLLGDDVLEDLRLACLDELVELSLKRAQIRQSDAV